jgi:hypothetical protein
LKSEGATYHVGRARVAPPTEPDMTHPAWQAAEVATVGCFRPEGSHHRPHTQVRLLHDEQAIHGLFTVSDRYVRSVHEGFQAPVWKDSCVEFFVRPRGHGGYFNFEMNAGGSLLSTYIVNWERVPGGFKEFAALPDSDLAQVTVPLHPAPPHRTGARRTAGLVALLPTAAARAGPPCGRAGRAVRPDLDRQLL